MVQTVSMKKGQCVKNSSLTSVKKCRRLTSSWSVMTTSGMLMTGFSKASKSGLTGVEKRRTLAPRPPGCPKGKRVKDGRTVCTGAKLWTSFDLTNHGIFRDKDNSKSM